MTTSKGPRFAREELQSRYAVACLDEDDWHRHSDLVTGAILEKYLYGAAIGASGWVLNAGAGVRQLGLPREISLDLFSEPIANRRFPVCANVSQLPFPPSSFDAVVCVGEVLAYCDPARTISEFARVIRPGGRLIVDFGSTRSWRVFATSLHGRSASLLVSEYNGSEERTWIYDPQYITHLLDQAGFRIVAKQGAHVWSTLIRRLGLSLPVALRTERRLWNRYDSIKWADTITIVSDLKEAS
jgi:SAM-dependent methyltransferase